MKTRNLVTSALITVLFIPLLAACGGPTILSDYGSYTGVIPGTRPGAHAGIDFGGSDGDPILAPADGIVHATLETFHPGYGCGKHVLIRHKVGERSYYTAHCHLSGVSVERDEEVKRGQTIGKMGATGRSGGVPHVHFEVCTFACIGGHGSGNLEGTLNPDQFFIGCFNPAEEEVYAAFARNGGTPRFVLTYPVKCTEKKKTRA